MLFAFIVITPFILIVNAYSKIIIAKKNLGSIIAAVFFFCSIYVSSLRFFMQFIVLNTEYAPDLKDQESKGLKC